jgi:hypothetical protein
MTITFLKFIKGHKIYPTFSISKPSKIYPTLGFWFENEPSGNPGNRAYGKD